MTQAQIKEGMRKALSFIAVTVGMMPGKQLISFLKGGPDPDEFTMVLTIGGDAEKLNSVLTSLQEAGVDIGGVPAFLDEPGDRIVA